MMTFNTSQPDVRAAAYLRMSSDRQELSLSTQLEAIRAYASKNGLSIVGVYEDAAKSGLSIAHRDGMKRLLRDVMGMPRPFDVVLVYDVSRWGRFQDIDAAAYYEYTCRMNGARVVYVQEPFGSDIDPLTALLKTLKRAMAAEYARELGVKTRAGQDQAIQLGFQMGSIPRIGIAKVAVDQWGNRRPLARLQRKSMQNERIVWEPGPQCEVDLVNHIFELYCAPEGNISKTARTLLREGVRAPDGRLLTVRVVDSLLRCEAFAGDFLWGRERLGGRKRKKRPETKAEGVIDRLVPKYLWDQAQSKLLQRRRLRRNKEQLLEVLRARLAENPFVTERDLEAMGFFSRDTYVNAFGSLAKALELAGRDPHAMRLRHIKSALEGRQIGDQLEDSVAALIRSAGIDCQTHPLSRVMLVANQCRIRTKLLWPRSILFPKRWHVPKVRRPVADWVLLAQMQDDKTASHFMLLTYAQYLRAPSWISDDPPPPLLPLRSARELQGAVLAALREGR
ncbi:recombinase family protein [Ottowia sp. VDI28]|uniref:recombinase family protein n=1 Tax=Ottowia sp. VDI28 TaxID=3133968 RepID=UPI003C308F8D